MKHVLSIAVGILVGAALHDAAMQKPAPGGYVIEHDAEVVNG